MPRWPHAPTRPLPTLRKCPRRSKPSFGSSQRSADPEPEPEPEPEPDEPEPEPEPEPDEPDPEPEADPDEPDPEPDEPDPDPLADPEPEAQHTVLRLQPEVHAWKQSRGASSSARHGAHGLTTAPLPPPHRCTPCERRRRVPTPSSRQGRPRPSCSASVSSSSLRSSRWRR